MQGTITKIKATERRSDFNAVNVHHEVSFQSLPKVGERFHVHQEGRGIWATSMVTAVKETFIGEWVITTTFSEYVLKQKL